MANPAPVCPECVAGKHGNCNGTAWDHHQDEPCPCACAEHDHGPLAIVQDGPPDVYGRRSITQLVQ